MSSLTVAEALSVIGFGSRYAQQHLAVMQIASIVCGMHTFVIVFLVLNPVPLCLKDAYPCDPATISLQRYCLEPAYVRKQYQLVSGSLILEWDIACNQRWLVQFVGVAYFFGSLLGSVVAGPLSDNYGRRRAFVGSLIAVALASVSGVWATSFQVFVLCRVLHGAACGALFMVTFVYGSEMCSGVLTTIAGCILQAGFALGYMVIVLVAYLWPSWQDLCIVPAIFAAVLLPWSVWLSEESPAWLAANGLLAKAHAVLIRMQGASDSNSLCSMRDVQLVDSRAPAGGAAGCPAQGIAADVPCGGHASSSRPAEGSSVAALCRARRLRSCLAKACGAWMLHTMGYYGLATSAEFLSGSIYVNCVWLAMMDLPALLLVALASVWFGNRDGTKWLMAATCLGCLGFLLPHPGVAKACVFAGQLCVTAAMSLICIYTAEVMPTQVRSLCMGIASAFGSVGAMGSMLLRDLGNEHPSLPMLAWGVACGLAALLMQTLPQATVVVAPPQTIEEFEERCGSTRRHHRADGE